MGAAAFPSPASALERRVVGHQLALGAVAREAHHHEAAGLDAHDHAVAELRVHHVVAERERGPAAAPLPAARLGRGCAAAPGGRGGGPCRRLLVAVGELDRDLVDEAAAQVPVAPAEEHARAGVREVELALRAGDPHVGEPALLLEVARLDRAHVREHAVLEPDDEDDRELEPLRVVEGHQRDDALLVAQVVLLREERELLEELLDRRRPRRWRRTRAPRPRAPRGSRAGPGPRSCARAWRASV